MQRSAWRPTSSARTSVRPLSSSTRWNVLALGGAGPHRGVGVHPLAGGRARQQLQEDLEVPPGRHELLDADDGDERLGQGQAHPAVALGLQDDERAGLGDREVGAGDGDGADRNALAQVQPGGLGQRARVVGGRRVPAGPTRPSAQEDLADLRRGCGGSRGPGCGRAGRRRAGRSARRGRSRTRVMPAAASASLRPISWVAIDLTLTTSVSPVAWTRSVTIRLASAASRRPVHRAARRGRRPPPAAPGSGPGAAACGP